MRQFDYVDEFIAFNATGTGWEYTLDDYRAWMDATYPEQAHKAATQLVAHRHSPGERAFTSECLRRNIDENGNVVEGVGVGRNAFYRVVETGKGVQPSSLLKMHLRESQEMVDRWENEARYRMSSVAGRSKKASEAFEMAKAEAKAVAIMLHARLRYFDQDDDDE